MPSIALFQFLFTQEKEISQKLVTTSEYKLIEDDALIEKVAQKHGIGQDKVRRVLHGHTSVFNRFTLERERITLYLRQEMVQYLEGSGLIFFGFIAQLVPSSITHVLRTCITDEKNNRVKKAVTQGLTERKALQQIKTFDHDASN